MFDISKLTTEEAIALETKCMTWIDYSDDTLKNVKAGYALPFAVPTDPSEFTTRPDAPDQTPRAQVMVTVYSPTGKKTQMPMYLTRKQIGKDVNGIFEVYDTYNQDTIPVYLANVTNRKGILALYCHILFPPAPTVLAVDFFGTELPESQNNLPERVAAGVNNVVRTAPVANTAVNTLIPDLKSIF